MLLGASQRHRERTHLTDQFQFLGGVMALFSMKLENLQQLYLKELRDLYNAEKQITDALPKLIDAQHR